MSDERETILPSKAEEDSEGETSYRLPAGLRRQDDESGTFFMSEPSVSDDGDASSGNFVRAPHRAILNRRGSYPPRFASSDDEDRRHGVLSPAPLRTQMSPAPMSPGNTSLSSWDSPAVQGRVLLHFTPESKPVSRKSAPRNDRNSDQGFWLSSQAGSPAQNGMHTAMYEAQGDDAPPPPPPPSAASNNAFLRNMRLHSGGFRFDGQGSGQRTSQSDDSDNEDQQGRVTSIMVEPHTQTEDESALAAENLLSPMSSIYGDSTRNVMDESIAMTLSDSEQEENADDEHVVKRKHISRADSGTQSADDERTDVRPQRVRKATLKQGQGHRRSRSGDAAAATIATGGNWKGMEQDRIPMPPPEEEEEDEDDYTAPMNADGNGTGYPGRAPRPPTKDQKQQRSASSVKSSGSPPTQHPKSNIYGSTAQRSSAKAGWPSSQGTTIQPLWVPRPIAQIAEQSVDSMWTSQPMAYSYDQQLRAMEEQAQALLASSMQRKSEESSSRSSESEDEEENRRKSVQFNRIQLGATADTVDLDATERRFENKFRGTVQKVMRPSRFSESPFANIGKKSAEKAPRKDFLPQASLIYDGKKYHYYTCPRCGTKQREFFTVDSAPRQLQGPSSYLALYFSIYVTASLFIFGLQEGWKPLDCIYFSVITLTTAGLGDFVPTSDGNKLLCSLFIYAGVACIGLLLGTYIAGMLDDRAFKDSKTRQMESCPNCKRIQTLKEAAAKRRRESPRAPSFANGEVQRFRSERTFEPTHDHTAVLLRGPPHQDYQQSHHRLSASVQSTTSSRSGGSTQNSKFELTPPLTTGKGGDFRQSPLGPSVAHGSASFSPIMSGSPPNYMLGSPVTRNILGRQGHTRHYSIDIADTMPSGARASFHPEAGSSTPPIYEGPLVEPSSAPSMPSWRNAADWENGRSEDSDDEDDNDSSTSSSTSSVSTIDEIVDERSARLRNMKYVFLTLKQALVNSMVIIAFGCIGFWLIEGFSLVDAWYFCTVLLTTVGYGDIVPVTNGGKLFATVYILVAGTILLNNMSLISMIPLELRKRRIERAVLTQFGDQLDDVALRELATGPVIQRLHLSANRPDGLDECTREMFSLAMLVRLGKVTEQDIREAFAAFRRLDVNDEGVLNSKSIIAAMIHKRRSLHSVSGGSRSQTPTQLAEELGPIPPPPPLAGIHILSDSLQNQTSVRIGMVPVSESPYNERTSLLQPLPAPTSFRSSLSSGYATLSGGDALLGARPSNRSNESPF